jgi:hypothetical protein
MSECFAEIAILEELNTLPANMQKVYLQLVSAIDSCLQRLNASGTVPCQLSETFIESLVDKMLDDSLSQEAVDEIVKDEFLRQILESSVVDTVS